jgi:hypothetical protein
LRIYFLHTPPQSSPLKRGGGTIKKAQTPQMVIGIDIFNGICYCKQGFSLAKNWFFHKIKEVKNMNNDTKVLVSGLLTFLVVTPVGSYLVIGLLRHTIDLAGALGIIAFLIIIFVSFACYLHSLAKQNGWC